MSGVVAGAGATQRRHRVNATHDALRPDLACFHSHIKALARGFAEGAQFILVMEDDAALVWSAARLAGTVQAVQAQWGTAWDVLMLGYSRFNGTSYAVPAGQAPLPPGAGHAMRVLSATGGTAYIVRRAYAPRLLRVFAAGYVQLHEGNDPTVAALDTWWATEQRRRVWVALSPPAALQAPSWSDLEARHTRHEGQVRGWVVDALQCDAAACATFSSYLCAAFPDGCCPCGQSVLRRRPLRHSEPAALAALAPAWAYTRTRTVP